MLPLLRSFTVFAAVLSASITFAGGDDLFSDVQTHAVFGSGVVDAGDTASRLTSADTLRDMLNAAGFDAKVAGARTVTLEKELAPWTFPVLLTISENEQNVAIVLGLRTVKDADKLTAETLLKMMKVSQQNAPAVFTYSETRERTEVYSVLKNAGISRQTLRDEINRMAIAAKDNSELWAADPSPTEEKAEELSKTPAPETKADASAGTAGLTGRWSAAKSATEAFAAEFRNDGTFALVYIKDGKQTKSSGQYTLTDSQLTLEGSDGLKLTGRVSISSDTEFRLTLPGSAALTFTKAS